MTVERWIVMKDEVRRSYSAEVDIVADFAVPCGQCNAHCTGTYRVWYVDQGRRVTFETDRSSLDEPLERLVETSFERGAYQSLPRFVRDWNEASGWADIELDDGATIPIDDLLRAVDALDQEMPSDDVRLRELLTALRELVSKADRDGHEVWVGET